MKVSQTQKQASGGGAGKKVGTWETVRSERGADRGVKLQFFLRHPGPAIRGSRG